MGKYTVSAKIAAFVNGGATIHDAWIVDATGNRVETLTAGSQFRVRVSFTATNSAATWALWSACVTFIDDTRTIRNFAIAKPFAPDAVIDGNLDLDWIPPGYNIMPNRNLPLTIRVFGNDSAVVNTPPDMAVW